MKLQYRISIYEPKTHFVKVFIHGSRKQVNGACLDFFLPVWSPGSYLVREYSRHIRRFQAKNQLGENLSIEQRDKNTWRLSFDQLEISKTTDFEIEYEVYCREIGVRNSFVDESHAFLHLPTLLMGVVGAELEQPTIQLQFTPAWSKITTGLKDISKQRDVFLYQADNYDDLIDCPIEIGCHETDGFMVQNIPHELAFYGRQFPHPHNLKKDIQTIVEYIATSMGEIPYERYAFITHFIPGMYGGLEHKNSTALHFDGTSLVDRKNYINWLCLVSHEYFHTWNVKRIRPRELGPFDYQKENHTTLLWLAEGLTSCMDELYVYRTGLIDSKEYLDLLKSAFDRYFAIPGKRFHSLEASSLNAWIKLYRPDENSNNSSISYYLKGGIVFLLLHLELVKKGKKIDDLLALLWRGFKQRPELGFTAEEVFAMVAEVGGQDIADKFMAMVQTTDDLPIEQAMKEAGTEFVWDTPSTAWFGASVDYREGRVYFEQIVLDGPAYQCGINSKDELLAIDGVRILKEHYEKLEARLIPDRNYQLTLARNGVLVELSCTLGRKPRVLKEIVVKDEALFKRTFSK